MMDFWQSYKRYPLRWLSAGLLNAKLKRPLATILGAPLSDSDDSDGGIRCARSLPDKRARMNHDVSTYVKF
jgi:hypothetical protein